MHIVTINPNADREAYPLWFQNAVIHASALALANNDQFWTWAWNREFEHKIKLRNARLLIHFNTEAELTMFALRWS